VTFCCSVEFGDGIYRPATALPGGGGPGALERQKKYLHHEDTKHTKKFNRIEDFDRLCPSEREMEAKFLGAIRKGN
jgi:hypothetical protein